MDWYPLRMIPILKEKVWGGRRLVEYGKAVPDDAHVGESWEVADLAETAPSGGGGGEARSVVADGPLAGTPLHQLVVERASDLLGTAAPGDQGGFPLLVKLLDAGRHLSVQVHPTAAYVAEHPGTYLKAESWFIVDAEPGSVIFKGLRPGTTREDLRAAVADGFVAGLLRPVPAIPGDLHDLPPGTVHALGAGVVVAEVQTPSDTTFRLYDWVGEYGRTERQLHVAEAIVNADLDTPPPPVRLREAEAGPVVVETPYFWMAAMRPCADGVGLPGEGDSVRVVMTVAGTAAVASHSGAFADLALSRGDTVVVPAVIAADAVLRSGDGATLIISGPSAA